MSSPRSTYRVQLHAGFDFDDAARVVSYLADLGVTHLYCSPYLQAAPGSTHGYDVVEHNRLNEELGGVPAYERLCQALEQHGVRQVVDIVPNHMAITARRNRWWWDVLANGRASSYAHYFDIDWDSPDKRIRGKVLLPILGDHYGRVLDSGELRIAREDGDPVVRYYEHSFPLSHASSAELDGDVIDELNADRRRLHEVLEQQHYRLAYWRFGDRALNYRRFFDIKTLIALRMEHADVFDEVHALTFDLVRQGTIDGLRIDHIDGIWDPEAYLARVRERCGDIYLVVEKILQAEEDLRTRWPVDGTSGYEFAARAGGLFVDAAAEEPLTRTYSDFTGAPLDVRALTVEKKRLVLRELLASDVTRLANLLAEVCETYGRDYSLDEFQEAVLEAIAHFPVYRTYIDPASGRVEDADERYVRAALDAARSGRSDRDGELFDFLGGLLLSPADQRAAVEFVIRFQQATGPAMAKGFEDTLLYNYNRLISLNEVGGDPAHFGISLAEFHRSNARAQERWPRSMLATSTHDTKRSEDVRARISLLSEIPDQWADAVARWSKINDRHRSTDLPDRNAEYLLYQTLVGAWPLETERAVAYMAKASKEAKVHTSWVDPASEYDDALRRFVQHVLADDEFVADLAAFVDELRTAGWVNSLAQTLVKLTSPGVPDIYQGTELWDLSLVDPDNRRPVDYERRRRLLAELKDMSAEDAWARRDEGHPKLLVTQRALQLRNERPDAFDENSTYEALWASGARREHVVAFTRSGQVMIVVPRLVVRLGVDWGDTALDLRTGRWRNVLTSEHYDGHIELGRLLARFPVALLAKERPG